MRVSRDDGRHWQSLLDQPVDALYANRTSLYVAAQDTLWQQKLTALVAGAPAPWRPTPLAPPYGPHRSMRQTTLYQLLHDLHSGKLLGRWFVYLLDIVAGLMLLQTVTGLFLWSFPRWQRWQRSRWRHKERADMSPNAISQP